MTGDHRANRTKIGYRRGGFGSTAMLRVRNGKEVRGFAKVRYAQAGPDQESSSSITLFRSTAHRPQAIVDPKSSGRRLSSADPCNTPPGETALPEQQVGLIYSNIDVLYLVRHLSLLLCASRSQIAAKQTLRDSFPHANLRRDHVSHGVCRAQVHHGHRETHKTGSLVTTP